MLGRPLAWFLDAILVFVALTWGSVTVRALFGLRSLPPLEELEPSDREVAAKVTVVVASRDDGEALEGAVRDLLDQERVPGLEVVAVDDRSRDGTPARLARLTADEPRLRAVRVDELPEGWLGKPHACWRGFEAADAETEWLLFVDADARLAPRSVARAVRSAERADAAHLCLIPQLTGQSLPGRATSLTLALGLAQQAAGIESDRARAYFGVGAFTLVRRDAYVAVGGHAALRGVVLEDVTLAGRLRAAGYRTRLRFAPDVFSVRWITTLRSAFTVLEKNYFALFDFRAMRCAAACVAGAGAWVLGLVGPWLAPVTGGLACTALVSLAVPAIGLARRYGWPVGLASSVPLLVPIPIAALAWSALVTLRRGGVLWRGTFYPMAELRKGGRRITPGPGPRRRGTRWPGSPSGSQR